MITTKLRYACMLKPGIREQYKVQRRMRGRNITLDTAAIPALADVNSVMMMYDRTGIVLQMGTKTAKIFDRVLAREHRQSLLTGHPRQANRFKQYKKRTARRLERRKKYRKMTRQEHIMVAEINKSFASYRPTDADSTKPLVFGSWGLEVIGNPPQVIKGTQKT